MVGPIPIGVATSISSVTGLLARGLYPVPFLLSRNGRHRIPPTLWPEIARRKHHASLRQLAREYGVSYETVRRALSLEAIEQQSR